MIPFFRRWEKFILGAIDILAITFAFQCSYYINYLDYGGFFFYHTRLLKAFLSDYAFLAVDSLSNSDH